MFRVSIIGLLVLLESVFSTQTASAESEAAEAAYEQCTAFDLGDATVDHSIEGCTEYIRLATEAQNKSLAYQVRSRLRAELNQFDLAISDLDKAIEADPSYAASYEARGMIFEKMGQREKAIADYRDALKVNSASDKSDKDLEARVKESLARLGAP